MVLMVLGRGHVGMLECDSFTEKNRGGRNEVESRGRAGLFILSN